MNQRLQKVGIALHSYGVFCNLNWNRRYSSVNLVEGKKGNCVSFHFTLRRNLIIVCTKKVAIQKNSPKTMEPLDYRQKYTDTPRRE